MLVVVMPLRPSSPPATPWVVRLAPHDIEVLERLRTPMWMVEHPGDVLCWANPAALRAWHCASIEDARARLARALSTIPALERAGRLEAGQAVEDTWIIEAQDQAWTVRASSQGVVLPDGRRGVLAEASATYGSSTSAGPDEIGELATRAARQQALLDALPDAVARLRGDGTYIDFRAQRDALVRSASSMVGSRVADAPINARAKETILRNLHACITTGTLRVFEFDLPEAEPSQRYQEARMCPSGEDEVIVFIRNISERRALEEARENFAAMVTHELRSPLSVVMGGTPFLRPLVEDNARGLEIVNAVEACAQRMKALVDDLLDAAKASMNGFALHLRDVELVSLLRAALRDLAPFAAESGVSVEGPEHEDEVLLHVDPLRLAQVFANLLSNAVKFTRAGEKVTVGIARRDHGLAVSFWNPTPIPENQLRRVFEKYEHWTPEGFAPRTGTGLGLYVARHLVDRMGGRITAESSALGGTTFTVQFPISTKSASAL